MVHVRFEADFDYRVPGKVAVTKAYKAGRRVNVTRDCSEKAIAAGKAVRVKPLGRLDKGGDGNA